MEDLDFQHFKDLVLQLNELRQRTVLCDVYLCAEKIQIPAHRVVLAAFSPYFSAMFCSKLKESQQPCINIEGIQSSILELIVDYAYSGKLEVMEENVQSLLKVASMLHLLKIEEICCHFLQQHLHPANCLGIRCFAEAHGCFRLQAAADSYAQEHFKSTAEHEEFLQLTTADMIDLVSRDTLNVKEEEDVYMAVMRWLEHDYDSRFEDMGRIMEYVRLPLVKWTFLMNKVGKDKLFTSREECRSYFQEAKAFQASLYHPDLIDFAFNAAVLRAQPRHGFSQAEYIFAVGGETSPGRSIADTVECYNPILEDWLPVPSMNVARRSLGAVVLNRVMYAIGGSDGKSALNVVEAYIMERKTWEMQKPMLEHRSSLAVGLLDNLIFACGGYSGRSSLQSVEKFDPEVGSWSEVADMHIQRSMAAAVGVCGRLYVVGGYDGYFDLSSTEMYSPKTNTWSQCTSMSKARSMLDVAELDGKIFAIGGCNQSQSLSLVEMYYPDTDLWITVSSLLEPRRGVGATVVASILYVFGGHDGNHHLSSIEKYNKETDEWATVTAHMNTARGRFGCCS